MKLANFLNKIIKSAIYLLVFLLPLFFLPFSLEAFEFNKQYLLFFLVFVTFLAWTAKMIFIDKEIRIKRSPLDKFVLAFVAISILSVVFSVNKFASLFGFYGRFSDGLISLISLVVFYFLITNNLRLEKSTDNSSLEINGESLIKIFLSSAFIVVLFGYFSFFGIWDRINSFISLPVIILQGIFNPISASIKELAIFLVAIIVLLVGMTLNDYQGKKTKIVFYLLLLFSLGLLVLINFSLAWFILLLSLVFLLSFSLKKRIFKEDINKLVLPIIVTILSLIFVFGGNFNIHKIILGYDFPVEQTLDQQSSWLIAVKSASENLKNVFFGSGIGAYHYTFAKFKPAEINQTDFWQVRFNRPGNHLSEVLATTGFLGLISYLLIIGGFFLISYFLLIQDKKRMGLFIAVLSLFLGQLFFYQNIVLAFTFWLFLAISVISWQKPLKEKVFSFREFPELSLFFSVLFAIFVFLFIGMSFFGTRFYLADVNYRKYLESGERVKLERAVELNPYQSQYKIVLAKDYLDKIIFESQKPTNEINEDVLSNSIFMAINLAKEATEISPNRVVAWEILGLIYQQIQGVAAGATDWGIKSIERAISLEPANPVLYTELGKLYFLSGEIDLAKENFTKAKNLKPDYPDVAIQIALVYEAEENLEEAIKEIEKAIAFYPYNVEAIFQLGRFYLNNNQMNEAISQLEFAIMLFPNHANSLYSLGVAYQRKGENEKSLAVFEKVLGLNPGNENVIQKINELKESKHEIIEEEDGEDEKEDGEEERESGEEEGEEE